MYSIHQDEFGEFDYFLLVNNENGNYVGIIPEHGGVLNEFVFHKEKTAYPLIDGFNTIQELKQKYNPLHKGSVQVPFPESVRKGNYTFKGVEYQLPVNSPKTKNSIHGLIYDAPFRVTSMYADNTRAVLELEYVFDDVNEGYPFPFKAEVRYILTGECDLTFDLVIENLSNTNKIPLGIGWNPYFKIGKGFEELQLRFAPIHRLELDENKIPTGETKKYNHYLTAHSIGAAEFDSCFELNHKNPKHLVSLYKPTSDVQLDIKFNGGKNGCNFVGVFTPSTRDSIMIEPMSCPPDALNNKKSLVELEPHKFLNLRVELSAF